MATYYVWSGASGTNAGTSWTNAYTAFGSAITAATTAGDIILVHKTHQEELAADTTYTLGADILIYCVDKDASDAAAVMGTGGWIGNSTTNRAIIVAGSDRRGYWYGITFRISGSSSDNMIFCNSSGHQGLFEQCYFWQGNTNTGALVNLVGNGNAYGEFINCTFRFGNAGQSLTILGAATLSGCSISSSGSTPTALVKSSVSMAAGTITFRGCDFSIVTDTLVPDIPAPTQFIFDRCELGSGVNPLASQTSNPTLASPSVLLLDCASGDTQGYYAYYDAYGSVIPDTGIYYTGSPAGGSWKIVTTSLASPRYPFKTPWMDLYNSTLSSMTPRLEILRDGSSTAFDNDEVWAESLVKDNSGFTLASFFTDFCLPNATPAAQANGAGLGSWTGESGTAWSGKIDTGAAVTPDENGSLTMRVCVGLASTTLYVNPIPLTA